MIAVTFEPPDPGMPRERCAICRTPTRYWFTPKDVAVCQLCAETVTPDDVPNKADWFKKEQALAPDWWR